jgi:uncharacterized delta-60 repeat protein
MPTPARLPRLAVALAAALLALPLALPLQAADGDLDPTYNGGAFTLARASGWARASVLEPIADGELLVGGEVSGTEGGDGWAVVKLEADGSRELVWSLVFQVVQVGDETMATTADLLDMRRDGSNRTYLAGEADAGIDFEVPMLARLGPNGGLDDTFDDNGLVVIREVPSGWGEVETRAAFLMDDGRSVFTGYCDRCPIDGERWVWVARRLADGGPDLSFSGDGWQTFRWAGDAHSTPRAVAVDESGRIVVLGLNSGDAYLARLAPSGNFDGSFGGGDGIAGPFAVPEPRALALDASTGRIAVGCGIGATLEAGRVAVFTSAGVLDTSFSGDGQVDLDFEDGTTIFDLTFQSDGKLLAVGAIDDIGANLGAFFLVRLTRGGALDSTYDGNGLKYVEFDAAPNAWDAASAVATMGGRLVAVGYAGGGGGEEVEMAVVRTRNAQIFSDGFERGSAGAWPGF